ncbi:hypothetical protein K469DRAFT_680132 [Zopfia rhizophila CBS 207.26]|uniref:Uncharacterized protein n=1 Tax=Zopfia rhizophila CBS 207.26 TaxID=1314779 RepID=A0A6A6D7J2_9PEZI|nr:hypothetical protein K469DRAFT_680132 [Zopfia rhizophila CBS 207.26]
MDGHGIREEVLGKLSPPISRTNPRMMEVSSTRRKFESFHPAITFQGAQFLRPNRDPGTYLALDLMTPRLNAIHQHLWLAGLPNAARPLHRQKLLGRNISVTEDPDEHLVWFEAQIFIKPLSDFLLDYDYWNDNLCSDQELYKSACGLLLSYAWLVRHQSDLDIAKESGLLSKNMEWINWVEFLDGFLDNINLSTLSQVNQRYKYGELRLSRLNTIYRVIPPTYSIKNFVRGYKSGSTWYNAFFERHFKWMLAVFAVLSVFLSALQVGLATRMLQDNGPFQRVSYGFALASVIAVVGSIALVFFVWLGLFWYCLISTWSNDRAVNRGIRTTVSSL